MGRIRALGVLVVAVCAMGAALTSTAFATVSVVWKHEGGPWESYTGETEIREPNNTVILQKTGEDLFYGGGEGLGVAAIEQASWNFQNVSLKGQLCTSSGAEPGEVRMNPLVGEFGILNAKTDEVGVELEPAKAGGLLEEFTCGATSVEVRGGLVGSVTPVDTLVSPGEYFTTTYSESKPGHQAFSKVQGGKKVALEISINKGKFKKVTFVGTDYSTPAFGPEELEVVKAKKTK